MFMYEDKSVAVSEVVQIPPNPTKIPLRSPPSIRHPLVSWVRNLVTFCSILTVTISVYQCVLSFITGCICVQVCLPVGGILSHGLSKRPNRCPIVHTQIEPSLCRPAIRISSRRCSFPNASRSGIQNVSATDCGPEDHGFKNGARFF